MARYPVYDLDGALKVAARLQEHGGEASSAQLAAYLGYRSSNNGAYLGRVAAARMFGLVEGQGNAIKVTPRALSILQPDYPATEERARLDAFEAVALYRSVVDVYHGQVLPPESGLVNALETRFGVPHKQASLALARLLSSAEQAGLFKVAGGRTRFVRPSISPASGSPTAVSQVPDPSAPIERSPRPNVKLIDGALDELPNPAEGWSEDGLSEWLALFEQVLRIVYKLPRSQAGQDRG